MQNHRCVSRIHPRAFVVPLARFASTRWLRSSCRSVATAVCGGLLISVSALAAGVVIVSPTNEETVRDNEGELRVEVRLMDGASFAAGQRVRLLVNGQAAGPDVATTQFQLSDVHRGSHRIEAVLVDQQGRPIATSEPVSVFMHQASRLFHGRQ